MSAPSFPLLLACQARPRAPVAREGSAASCSAAVAGWAESFPWVCSGGRETIVSLWCCHRAWAALKVHGGNLYLASALLKMKIVIITIIIISEAPHALQATEDASV